VNDEDCGSRVIRWNIDAGGEAFEVVWMAKKRWFSNHVKEETTS
jgi:hypothetical protein